MHEAIVKEFREYSSQVFRVLTPNGRIFVTIPFLMENILLRELKNAGFEITSKRQLSPQEIIKGASHTAKQTFITAANTPDNYKEMIRRMSQGLHLFRFGDARMPIENLALPYRVSARKPVSRK